MTITTKFNPGEKVWVMMHNKPTEVEIYEVIPGVINTNFRNMTSYTFTGYNANSPKIYEDEIYKTKQELIEAL